ncbi:unnamed protein product [Linum trigynum]|uniref:Uncharacterized protein n=1 Tax=Linum trigynum TaxID=586398 RepID=A0AAV2EC60_9ROSI
MVMTEVSLNGNSEEWWLDIDDSRHAFDKVAKLNHALRRIEGEVLLGTTLTTIVDGSMKVEVNLTSRKSLTILDARNG